MSLIRLRSLTIATLVVALVPAAQAQRSGTIELGAFARQNVFDADVGLDDLPGVGGRFGWYFANHWLFEADAGLTPTKSGTTDVNHIPVHARLLGAIGIGPHISVFLGAGWAYNQFKNGSSVTENGVGGLAGLQLRLTHRLAIRGDLTADYMLDHAISADPNVHLGAQVGASLLLFAGSKDRDKDGVENDADLCADTPSGTRVEATGCPDADGDRVADQIDRCAGTPAGSTVDALGCTDADGDGVVDPQDRCFGTPAGVAVDATGCPMDADRDGVPDVSDRCAGTAAGVAVNETGCPIPTDADADGVLDADDRCPASPAGGAVDASGCPVVGAIVLEGVSFLSGSAQLTLDSQGPLNEAASRLAERPDLRVVIEGHTDNVGDREANIRLSRARADAVRAYFISKGIAAARMTTVGFGPDQPVASNATPEGRAQNRRVQVRPAQ